MVHERDGGGGRRSRSGMGGGGGRPPAAGGRTLPALLIGETGVGKTLAVRYLAWKTQNGLRRLNLNGATTVDEFLGKMLINEQGTYWVNGVLVDCMLAGDWILLDEINACLPG